LKSQSLKELIQHAVTLQILTYMQQATCIAMAFPYIADEPRILETLAAQRNETPLSMLTQPAGLDDFEHDSSWLQIASYLSSETQDKLNEHVPLMSNHLVALFQMPRGDAVPNHEISSKEQNLANNAAAWLQQ